MPLNLETVKGIEDVATIIRSRLKQSPVYLSTLNEVIKGCRKLQEDSGHVMIIQLITKIHSFHDIAQGMHKNGEFDEEAYACLKTYWTLLTENVPK